MYVEITAPENFEGKSGFAGLFAFPPSFLVALILMFVLFRFAQRRSRRMVLTNVLLAFLASPAIILPLSLI